MKAQTEIPEIEIAGKTWLVDVDGFQIIDKENPSNTISAADMRYCLEGYSFLYNREKHCLAPNFIADARIEMEKELDEFLYVQIPNFIEMDLGGTAKRYGFKKEELLGETDYNILIDRNFKINNRSLSSGIEERVFFHHAKNRKMPIEIPAGEFMLAKFQYFSDMIKAKPLLAEHIEHQYPEMKEDLAIVINEFRLRKALHQKNKAPLQDQKKTYVRRRKIGR
ncbi:hypothetical protein [Fluviicola sp.]|uniref:hypothetical protein n=1 Tax=Fluviicola sp. TaxID=1917219 RepID=UPI0031D4889F